MRPKSFTSVSLERSSNEEPSREKMSEHAMAQMGEHTKCRYSDVDEHAWSKVSQPCTVVPYLVFAVATRKNDSYVRYLHTSVHSKISSPIHLTRTCTARAMENDAIGSSREVK